MIFTIEKDTNNIAVHATAQDAKRVPNTEVFQNEAALTKLAAKWPAERLVEIWNALPGEAPVKKLTDRKKAAARMWKAVQSLLGATVAPRTPPVAPKQAPAKKSAARAKRAHTAAPKAKVSAQAARRRRCWNF